MIKPNESGQTWIQTSTWLVWGHVQPWLSNSSLCLGDFHLSLKVWADGRGFWFTKKRCNWNKLGNFSAITRRQKPNRQKLWRETKLKWGASLNNRGPASPGGRHWNQQLNPTLSAKSLKERKTPKLQAKWEGVITLCFPFSCLLSKDYHHILYHKISFNTMQQ